jgi:hypothetical protein
MQRVNRTDLINRPLARLSRCAARAVKRAKKTLPYPSRYTEDFLAKFCEVAARRSSTASADIYETSSSSLRYAQFPVGAASAQAGMVSLLFVVIVFPLILIMFTLTIELSNFFGIRDELQRVVDREAHDALVRGRNADQVERLVRARSATVDGMAAVESVTTQRSPATVQVSAVARYQGAFFQFIQRLVGQEQTVMPMRLDSQVRVLPAATLIVFDREVQSASIECSSADLQAITSFVDRLADTWVGVASAEVAVAVTPGDGVPLKQLSPLGDDLLPRCRGQNSGHLVDAAAIRGTGVPAFFSAYRFAVELVELASSVVLNRPVLKRSIVLVLDRARYAQGYSSLAYSLLVEATSATGMAVDLYTIVVDNSHPFDRRMVESGINGGELREMGISRTELNGTGLLSALTRTVTDYVVLER